MKIIVLLHNKLKIRLNILHLLKTSENAFGSLDVNFQKTFCPHQVRNTVLHNYELSKGINHIVILMRHAEALSETCLLAGGDRFYLNIEDMIGYKPFFLIKWCWMILTPGICAVSLTLTHKHE